MSFQTNTDSFFFSFFFLKVWTLWQVKVNLVCINEDNLVFPFLSNSKSHPVVFVMVLGE